MATTPEYGEELLMGEREEEVEEASRGPLPKWEDIGEDEVAEQELSQEEKRRPGFENHELHMPGAVCAACGIVLEEGDDVRRTSGGGWVHEVCP